MGLNGQYEVKRGFDSIRGKCMFIFCFSVDKEILECEFED